MDYIRFYNSPMGEILLRSNGEALTGLYLRGQKYSGEYFSEKQEEKELPVFDRTSQWLDIYFAGREPDFPPPLCLKGTPFREEVWKILLRIPYGKTVTYGDIAREMAGKRGVGKMSAQAVGGAVGHNPVSLIVPCHRGVGADGSLTGYGGGIDKKVKLLTLEKADMSGLFVPRKGTAL